MAQSILIIDDAEDIHALLDVRLRPEGLNLHHVLDAEEGMALAERLKPDLILLDVDMPNFTGFEVCQRLKADPATAEIPVIFLTAANQSFNIVQGFDMGAVDYVVKPFEVTVLRARVRAALRTKRYHDLLATRAQLDALTGLWNRTFFNARIREEISATRRYNRTVSLILVDLDHFKRFNDTYGHPFGDRVLHDVAQVLATGLRPTDVACRLGGEEFALILSETGLAGAHAVGDRTQERLAKLCWNPNGKARESVTASMGVSSTEQFPAPHLVSIDPLIKAADEALYDAKRSGRNRICEAWIADDLALNSGA